jgi:hypothetical protein
MKITTLSRCKFVNRFEATFPNKGIKYQFHLLYLLFYLLYLQNK